MASTIDKIVTNIYSSIEKVIEFFRSFVSSSEEEITVDTDPEPVNFPLFGEVEEVQEVSNEEMSNEEVKETADSTPEGLDDDNHQLEPTSESPAEGAFLNITEVLSAEESDILGGSESGNNTSVVDPSLFSLAVSVNQLPEISSMASDF